ncbi:O-antigen ligase family protein [Pontibacillus salicampi]|uniref:O-antigen ligase family protein n=1 Tax=Pontibacillus salicampi TaxID=1449801 RepID=A0ABV6LSB3_9BACI
MIIAPKSVQLILFLFLLPFILPKKFKLDIPLILGICYIIIYASSIIINVFRFDHEIIRVIASGNNLLIWILAFLFYVVYKENKVEKLEVTRILKNNFYILIFLYYASLFLYFILDKPNISLFGHSLYDEAWFDNNLVIRFSGFTDYANLVIMFVFLFFPFFLHYINNKSNNFYKFFMVMSVFLVVVQTYSRSGYVLLIFPIFFSITLYLQEKLDKRLLLLIYMLNMVILVVILSYTPASEIVYSVFLELLNAREGSTETRSLLLTESINITNTLSPYIGMGIKTLSPFGLLPYGSHSTFVGFFYKSGYIGLIITSFLFIVINLKLITFLIRRDHILRSSLSIHLIMVSAMFFVEDIDGTNWLLVFYFILVGYVFNSKNWSVNEK